MPRQNRVTPLGEVIATPERGLVYANRGCIHDANGRIRNRYPTGAGSPAGSSSMAAPRPRSCPRQFTELLFLDEASALAAGHGRRRSAGYADYEH